MKLNDLLESHWGDDDDSDRYDGQGRSVRELKIYYENKLLSETDTYDGDLDLENLGLNSLDGCPRYVHGNLELRSNRLEDFVGGPEKVYGHVNLEDNDLYDLHEIHKHLTTMKGHLWLQNNVLRRNVLGILLIKGCQRVEVKFARGGRIKLGRELNWVEILNRYLPNDGYEGMYACQTELIEAGLSEYANL